MCQKRCLRFLGLCGILAVLSGCAAKRDQAGDNARGSITVQEVKTAVLENAGLSEDQVRFVRIHLDSEDGADRYEVEFLCETAEYDYTVSAKTGEILSMNFETGDYDIAAVPDEILPSADMSSADTQSEGQPGTASADTGAAGQPGTAAADTGAAGQTDMPSGNAQPGAEQYIGADAAKRTALEHAGLQTEEVRFRHARLELDDGRWLYDVEFYSDTTEYEYEIDAQSGAVLSFDREAAHERQGGNDHPADLRITAEDAKRIALEYAGIGGTEAQYLEVEYDYDDGRAEYEVSWYVGRTEYSCDIDAATGGILSFEKEPD